MFLTETEETIAQTKWLTEKIKRELLKAVIPNWINATEKDLSRATTTLSEMKLKQVATRLRKTYLIKKAEGKANEQTARYIEELSLIHI